MNDSQPVWVAERTAELVAGIDDPKISVWGVAYKGNVDDARETPAIGVIESLKAKGFRVSAVDFRVRRFRYELDELEASVTGADCIVVLADHREFQFFEPEAIGRHMRHRLLFDTRACIPRARWEQAAFRVVTL